MANIIRSVLVNRTTSYGGSFTDYVLNYPQSTIRKMRSALPTGFLTNPVTAQPLIAPPAWVTATAYANGQAVSNAGNAYICNVAIASSAAAPAVTTTGPITDGSGSWYYYGPTWTSSALAPTVTATTTRYNTGIYYGNTANTNSLGATNIKDSSNFLLSPGNDGGGTGNSYSWTSSTVGTAQFICDAPQLQIVVQATANPGLCVWVGPPGGLLTPIALGIVAPNPSAFNYYQFVFADRRPRQFFVEMPSGLTSSGIASFYGVICNDTISKVSPPNPSAFTMGFVGTSYYAGNQTLFPTAALGIAPQIAKALGCTQYWVDEKGGGTGYVQAGVGGIYQNATRLANLTAFNPDLLVISGGGINDQNAASISGASGGASGAAAFAIEQAAASNYYNAVRAALPNAVIVVIGSEAGATGPSAAVFNMEAAVASAFTIFAESDPNCFYIPQAATVAQKAIISGTGTVAATNGTGNSDVYVAADAIHTVMAGSNYLAYRCSSAMISLVNGLTY